MELGDEEHLGGVHEVPVAKFVREDSFNLGGRGLGDESVEDDDVLALSAVLVFLNWGTRQFWLRTQGKPKK